MDPKPYNDNGKMGVTGVVVAFAAFLLALAAFFNPWQNNPPPTPTTPVPCVTCVSYTPTPVRTPGLVTTPTPARTPRPVSTLPVPVPTK